jgi:hypothetical protein
MAHLSPTETLDDGLSGIYACGDIGDKKIIKQGGANRSTVRFSGVNRKKMPQRKPYSASV